MKRTDDNPFDPAIPSYTDLVSAVAALNRALRYAKADGAVTAYINGVSDTCVAELRVIFTAHGYGISEHQLDGNTYFLRINWHPDHAPELPVSAAKAYLARRKHDNRLPEP